MERPLPSSLQAGRPSTSQVNPVGPAAVGAERILHAPHPTPLTCREPAAVSPQTDSDLSRRQPRAAKKASGKDDELRAAIDRQILEDEQRAATQSQSHHQQPSQSRTPVQVPPSPPTSPPIMSTSKETIRSDRLPPLGHRTASIDSAVSSISSTASASQRPNGASALRASHDNTGPQDVAALLVAAGSAEAALQKLVNEKQQAASHNAQLWRLVEKQRAMILGLNKDLEKALKDKERYRKKLKDHQAQANAASVSVATAGTIPGPSSLDSSPSSSQVSRPADGSHDVRMETKKTVDGSERIVGGLGRSDTPQDISNGGTSPAAQSATSPIAGSRALHHVNAKASASALEQTDSKHAEVEAQLEPLANMPPVSPQNMRGAPSPEAAQYHYRQQSSSAVSVQPSPPPSAQSFYSPKTRKAPPAPLNLINAQHDEVVVSSIVDASDSEYEEDPESAREEYIERGRRKTREDDDREREAIAREEEEQRSRSKKEKKSRSRPSAEKSETPLAPPVPKGLTRELSRPQPLFDAMANPADIIRNRVAPDAAGMMQRSTTAPTLLSPGLPMSPRPGDRPPNSPVPRPPIATTNSIPMSPRAGLPLSPRAPRQPIPPPPQTPLASISSHLDRAKVYHQQMQAQAQSQPNFTERLKSSADVSPEGERPPTSNNSTLIGTDEVYQGLVTEQYPELLLPPNALPSIYVKTASSRMKPSRISYIQPKSADENPVFTLAVHERSDNQQLWRIEKTFAALQAFDLQVKAIVAVRDKLPDKQLFTGHAPAKIDARRLALNVYFERILDAVTNEKAAMVVCRFLSADAVGSDSSDFFGRVTQTDSDSLTQKLRPNMAGYLTKRGKNFGGWKARYFVLDGPSLKYFEGRGGAHLGSIKLQNAQIGKQSTTAIPASQDDEDNQFRHAFLILEPKKKDSSSLVRHVLCAESDEERDAWVDALLQYVDYRDDEDQIPARQAQVSKTDISGQRSPRLQKSMNDLRPSTANEKDMAVQGRSMEQMRSVGYSDTIAGEAPTMGQPTSPRIAQTPSPPFDQLPNGQHEQSAHPTISAPTNLHVIQNAGDWGMKPPSTPGGKDKKRSMFPHLPFSRGRSSSDGASGDIKSPTYAPSTTVRGVFGAPLVEAVAFAHPADATTELPAVVYRCIEYLTAKNAVAEEGIFRLSGSSTTIKALKERFNNEGDVDLLHDGEYYDVHAVAGLLKLYLRELPASILTRDLHLDFLKCLELPVKEKINELNKLVKKLPAANRALLEALSAFMLLIIDNVGVNKMNVRNLGVVFSPTLNLPGPLISLLVEEQRTIFGAGTTIIDKPVLASDRAVQPISNDLRSPRRQMFSELPTPAYNQTQFQPIVSGYQLDDTGMIPMQPSYAQYQMAPQGEGGFGSLNDALKSPTVYGTTGTGEPTPRDIKARRRESGMLLVNNGAAPQKTPSIPRLRDEQGTSF